MLFFFLLTNTFHVHAFPSRGNDNNLGYYVFPYLSIPTVPQNYTVQTVPWQQEPRARGTFRLVLSCLITLSLCVWTAIHLNIVRFTLQATILRLTQITQPKQHTSASGHYMRKTRWVLIGLFAPEMVVYVAWRQYKSAALLTKAMNEVFDKECQERKHSWTIVHSFYAGMGGFVMDTANSLREPYTRDSPRLSLGSRGVLFVARHGGYIPDMSEAFIFDRSKADNVGKFLVCLQAGWAVVQCISRLGSHLPLTLLEINTLGHVLCAFLMYLFWLRKPLDVNEPTMLMGKWIPPMCAWLLMSNSLDSKSTELGIELSGLHVYPGTAREMSPLAGRASQPTPSNDRERRNEARPGGIILETQPENGLVRAPKSIHSSLGDTDSTPLPLREYEILSGAVFGPKPNMPPNEVRRAVKSPLPTRTVNLDLITITRWRLASKFISQHWDVLGIDPAEDLPEGPLAPNAIELAGLIMLEVPDWPGLDQLSGHTTSTFAKLCAATALYGGLHAGAWNSFFPSAPERLLWRISVALIAGSGLTAGVVATIKHWKDQDDWKQLCRSYTCRYLAITPSAESAMIKWFSGWSFCAYTLSIMATVPWFILARLFLVAEAFISLRKLPIEAYLTPAWTQWIPHL